MFPIPFEPVCEKPLKVGFYGDLFINTRHMEPTKELFSGLHTILSSVDFNVVNFEGTVTDHKTKQFPDFPFALNMPKNIPPLLREAGITHVTRANNHTFDFGLKGMLDTDAALKAADIKWAGSGMNMEEAMQPMRIEKHGMTVAVLSFSMTFPEGAWAGNQSPGTAYAYPQKVKEAVENAKTEHDFVVTLFHWGREGTRQLRAYQREMARIAVESGSDFVAGHHAHIAQAIDSIDGKTVAYGLGNFVFSSKTDLDQPSLGALAQFCKEGSDKAKTVDVVFVPLDTHHSRTNFSTRPHSASEFEVAFKPYFTEKHFMDGTRFYLPSENRLFVHKTAGSKKEEDAASTNSGDFHAKTVPAKASE